MVGKDNLEILSKKYNKNIKWYDTKEFQLITKD